MVQLFVRGPRNNCANTRFYAQISTFSLFLGIFGRYYPKNVDITINYKGKAIAGYAVKFAMRNYSQNSNNYFENMT